MKRKYLLFFAIAVFAVVGIRYVSMYPLLKSEGNLHAWVLQQVPIGSSMSDVEDFVAKRHWKMYYRWHGQPSQISEKQFPGVRGEQIIGAILGHYQGLPWRVDIDAYWGFDETGKLIDLRVRKTFDAL